MTVGRSGTVVLRDAEGASYLLTPALLLAATATTEQQAAIEDALATEDTRGFLTTLTEAGALSGPIILNRFAATIPVSNDLAAVANPNPMSATRLAVEPIR
jgi:hypothetical protein